MNKNAKYAVRLFTFMRPYMPYYIPGLIIYSAQMFTSYLINSVAMNLFSSAVINADARAVVIAGLLYGGLYGVFLLIVMPGTFAYVTAERKAIRSLKAALFRRFVKTSIEGGAHSGEGIAAINTDAETAANLYGNSMGPLLSCVISIVFSALVVFMVDYRLGLCSVAIGLLAFFIQYRFSKPLGKIAEATLTSNAASVKSMTDILAGALVIRASGAQERALTGFDRENGKMLNLSFKGAFISMWQSFFTTIEGWLTLTGVFALGGYLVATGRLDFPSLMLVPFMCMAISDGMSGIGGAWASMQAPIAASRRVFDVLDSGADEGHKPRGTKKIGDGYAFRLDGLSFRYKAAKDDALRGVTLDIGENEMAAFVGESGSGKSTLLRTVIGMYEREDLPMSLGGARFDDTDIASWRSKFAYVDQSCKLFDMSIAENIALGAPSGASLEEIKTAANAAGIGAFIASLPEGYDTPCGERGASLSGGQRQRIAIARALVRKAPVLVFDEAASALDAESEKLVLETIDGLRGTHTILITSHNLQSVMSADKIIVMDGGQVAQSGRHDELVTRDGLYKRLFLRGTEGA